jgi:sec-independent protein translocase protein TatA
MVYGLSSLIMGIIAGSEWLVIGLIIMIMITFGSRKIPEFARSFGRARSDFNKAKIEDERQIQNVKEPLTSNINNREKLEIAANTLGIDSANKSDEEL